MALFREFLLIVAAGFIGSALGSAFGAVVGLLFPDFVAMLWRPQQIDAPIQLGAAMGMVAGLPIGATAMVVGRLVGAVRWWVGIRDGEGDSADPTAIWTRKS